MRELRLKKIPIAATPIRIQDLFYFKKSALSGFAAALENYLGIKHCLLTGSGIAAFYLILKALSRISNKKEVILPAYTAPTLVLAITRLGLKVRLCDISLSSFNIEIDQLQHIITDNTLCIVAVHLFGIPCEIKPILDIAEEKGIFVIEDVAQAQGVTLNGIMAGALGDIGFFSFNRGKNLPTYSGGCIVTNSTEIADFIKEDMKGYKYPSIFSGFAAFFKLAGLNLATRPIFYGLFYPLISRFKSNDVPGYFTVSQYTHFQAQVGLALLRRIEEFCQKRQENGMCLLGGLKDIEVLILPSPFQESRPVFNRLPILFKDFNKIGEVEKAFTNAGIETSRMYLRPIHHIFDLGYKEGDFPNATYFARHLLTLPAHPLLERKDLLAIIQIIKDVVVRQG